MPRELDNRTQLKSAHGAPKIPDVKPQDTSLDRFVVIFLAIVPILGILVAIVLLWGQGIGAMEIGTAIGMYIVTGVGVTMGYHRLFGHRAFETNTTIRVILAIAGSMAGQKSLLRWVASHRRHHKHSDRLGDRHSPHLHGEGIFARLQGLWHAHAGWVFAPERASVRRYAPDLLQDRLIVRISRLYLVWVFLGLAIPALVGGLLTWTWMGALRGLLWGGFVRLFLFYNIVSTIASIGHVYGSQPFQTHDQSRNNFWLALVSFGDSWHNNHHAFPRSADHGLKWWQIDPNAWLIRALEIVGLAWNVTHPTAHMIGKKRHAGIAGNAA